LKPSQTGDAKDNVSNSKNASLRRDDGNNMNMQQHGRQQQ
jgi:hypothetical protein